MGWRERLRGLGPKPQPRARRMDVPIPTLLSDMPVVVRDSQNRQLGVGDEVVVLQPGSLSRIASIEPWNVPGAQVPLMKVRLISSFELVLPRGASIEGVIRCSTAAELEAMGQSQGNASVPPAKSTEDVVAERVQEQREASLDRAAGNGHRRIHLTDKPDTDPRD